MEFFKSFAESGHASMGFVIVNKNGKLHISVNPVVGLEDKNAKTIPPLMLKGTPEELDEKFFETINEPLEESKELIGNLREFEENAKKLAEQNAIKEAEKKEKNEKQNEERKKLQDAYKKTLKAVEDGKLKKSSAEAAVAKIKEKAKDVPAAISTKEFKELESKISKLEGDLFA